jgi:hypothetical protein
MDKKCEKTMAAHKAMMKAEAKKAPKGKKKAKAAKKGPKY